MSLEHGSIQGARLAETTPPPDAHLIRRLRRGDADAGHQFVQEYYPGVYRYLLYLTGSPELAEDLTQEAFLQAWRHLDTFREGAPLWPWLHRIAHREFLQALRSRRLQVSLEEVGELRSPCSAEMAEEIELRVLIGELPVEQREIVVLHYLEGYEYGEVAQILGIPVGRVRHRLSEARSRLQQELGEGDLIYLNEPAAPMRQWSWLPLDQMRALESRLGLRSIGDREAEEMQRREFLRHAAAGAVGLMLPESEKAIVDRRLAQKVSLACKGIALSDLCEHLRSETGVSLTAGPSVADEKVTLFCEKLPLREVMRQLSRPFGYTWLRSASPRAGGTDGTGQQYRYELEHDLRSQLLEEELRNRNRNEALLALDREIAKYRPYLGLMPDEALSRSKIAPPAEKRLLETLAGPAWSVIQMYCHLSAQEQAALRAREEVRLSEPLRPGEQPRSPWFGRPTLPPELGRGVLQSIRDMRLVKRDEGYEGTEDANLPGALLPAAVPEARGMVRLEIWQSELGQFTLHGVSHAFTIGSQGQTHWVVGTSCDCATGESPSVRKPNNAMANTRFAGDSALRARVSIQPQSSCPPRQPTGQSGGAEGQSGDRASEPNVTTADVLEALHRASGLPIVSDYYTRTCPVGSVSLRSQPLLDALNTVADTMRLRWNKEGGWLQFRSTSFYDDRLKEVPNRLLERWASARRQRGALTIDDLCEIAQLPDAQLDGREMAEGARECYGLAEWDLARNGFPKANLRFLATFTPAQRQEAMSAAGLPFKKMSLAQQQKFIAFALRDDPLQSLEELDGAVLRVEYTQPGGFQWGEPGWCGYYTRWVIPLGPGSQDRRVPRPPVQARTREAALAAVRQIDPQLREALFEAVHRADARVPADPRAFEESQIFPTQRYLTFVYIPGSRNARPIYVYAGTFETHGQLHYRQR